MFDVRPTVDNDMPQYVMDCQDCPLKIQRIANVDGIMADARGHMDVTGHAVTVRPAGDSE